MLRRLFAIAIASLACGCEDWVIPETPGTTTDTSSETTTATTSESTSSTSETTTSTSETTTSTPTTEELGACLDRPTDLARPPAGKLPCELLPPGF